MIETVFEDVLRDQLTKDFRIIHEGEKAFVVGKSDVENPYIDERERACWDLGWDSAKDGQDCISLHLDDYDYP